MRMLVGFSFVACALALVGEGMEERKDLEMSKETEAWKKLRRGWCWGPKGFREEPGMRRQNIKLAGFQDQLAAGPVGPLVRPWS